MEIMPVKLDDDDNDIVGRIGGRGGAGSVVGGGGSSLQFLSATTSKVSLSGSSLSGLDHDRYGSSDRNDGNKCHSTDGDVRKSVVIFVAIFFKAYHFLFFCVLKNVLNCPKK